MIISIGRTINNQQPRALGRRDPGHLPAARRSADPGRSKFWTLKLLNELMAAGPRIGTLDWPRLGPARRVVGAEHGGVVLDLYPPPDLT